MHWWFDNYIVTPPIVWLSGKHPHQYNSLVVGEWSPSQHFGCISQPYHSCYTWWISYVGLCRVFRLTTGAMAQGWWIQTQHLCNSPSISVKSWVQHHKLHRASTPLFSQKLAKCPNHPYKCLAVWTTELQVTLLK